MHPDRLKTIPLFSSLSDKALDTVSVFASETSVSTGKRLVDEGDYPYDLIVIESGTADVIKGGEVIGRWVRATTSARWGRSPAASVRPTSSQPRCT